MVSLFGRRGKSTVALEQVDPQDDGSIVEFVTSRWKARAQYRNAIERQWYTNIHNYLGFQYHYLNNTTGMLQLPPAPSYRVRLVCNRLMPIVRKIVSKVLRSRPIWTVLPATNEEEDAMVARLGTKILQYYWRYGHMDTNLKEAVHWMATTGNAFLRCFWDPGKGDEVEIQESQFTLLEEDDQAVAKDGVYTGDLVFESCSPFEIDPDTDCLKLEDATHLIHTKARSLGYLTDRYGKAAAGLRPDLEDADNLTRYFEKRIQSLAGPAGFVATKNPSEESHAALTHSLWVPPNRRLPKGFHAVVANERVLHKNTLPKGLTRLPYVHFREVDVPGRFWGTCSLEQCLPLQISYNRGRSQVKENVNLMSRPKWLVANGSGVKEHQLTSEPGEVIHYRGPFKPEAWTPPPIPEYVFRAQESDLKDLEDISFIHEVTQARAPSGVRSGVAITALQEQDDQALAAAYIGIETAMSELGSMGLQLVAHNATEERLIRVVGDDKTVDIMPFVGKSLFGKNMELPGANYFDVQCQLGSQLPLNKNARRQVIMDLIDRGLLHPQQDRKKIFQILDLGTEEPVLDEDRLDRACARRENIQMFQMIQVEPNSWDNDEIHLEEHLRFEKQPEYKAQGAPEVFAIMETHKRFHALRLQAMAMPPPAPGQPAPQPQQEPQPPAAGTPSRLPEE